MPESLPEIIDGRYALEEVIGEGGMGTVYGARHLKLERRVAVKVLLREYGESSELRARFEREAKTLAAMQHPHIVAVTDYGLVEDAPFLVMEYLDGEALDEVIAGGAPIAPGRVREIFEQTLRALAFAHAEGIAHRDLKPANIFLQAMSDVPVHVKLLDFGLAKFVSPERRSSGPVLTKTGTVVGTPAYMAPEQATGQGADERSDVYSAGIMLFELLAGARPFVGAPPDLIRQHLVAPLPRIGERQPGLEGSAELEAFLAKATAKDPAHRFADAGEMLSAFAALPAPLVTGTPRPAEPMGRPSHAPTALGKGPSDAAYAPTAAVAGATSPATSGRRPLPARASASAQKSSGQRSASRVLPIVAGLGTMLALAASLVVGIALFSDDEVGAADPEGAPRIQEAPTRVTSEASHSPELPAGEDVPTDETGERTVAETIGDHVTDALEVVAGEPDPGEGVPPVPTSAEPQPDPSADPWADPVPEVLANARRVIASGREMRGPLEAALRRYAARNRDDPRAFLLLGHGYVTRGWRPDAIERYERAYEIDPAVRNDPRLGPNLVLLAGHQNVGRRATALLRQVYGTSARGMVERTLAEGELSRDQRRRIEALRDSL